MVNFGSDMGRRKMTTIEKEERSIIQEAQHD